MGLTVRPWGAAGKAGGRDVGQPFSMDGGEKAWRGFAVEARSFYRCAGLPGSRDSSIEVDRLKLPCGQ